MNEPFDVRRMWPGPEFGNDDPIHEIRLDPVPSLPVKDTHCLSEFMACGSFSFWYGEDLLFCFVVLEEHRFVPLETSTSRL
jgi:hypothetical protein